jgi:hypothetical protein
MGCIWVAQLRREAAEVPPPRALTAGRPSVSARGFFPLLVLILIISALCVLALHLRDPSKFAPGGPERLCNQLLL